MTYEELRRRQILPSWWLEMEDAKNNFFNNGLYVRTSTNAIVKVENGEIKKVHKEREQA